MANAKEYQNKIKIKYKILKNINLTHSEKTTSKDNNQPRRISNMVQIQ
jgi:hypothetical protein